MKMKEIGESSDSLIFYFIGNCCSRSGTPARIALQFLLGQNADFALFYAIKTIRKDRTVAEW